MIFTQQIEGRFYDTERMFMNVDVECGNDAPNIRLLRQYPSPNLPFDIGNVEGNE